MKTNMIIYQSSHQNTEYNFEKIIKVVGKQLFFFSTNIKDTWIPIPICYDRNMNQT